jgi:putative phage-type endonuclease
MSFGNINGMLTKTIKLLEHNVGSDGTTLNLSGLHIIKKQVYRDLQKEYADVTLDIVDEIFNRLFNSKYKFCKDISFDDGKNCFREFEETYPDIKVPSKYKKLSEHFEKLKNLPQPAQRSKEWYDYRYNRITASDAAAAIDLNPYEPVESFILKKCDPNFPFRDNATVFHGKKYEPTATMIYEHIYNTRVFEFGALPSDKYTFLGASPDGISSKYTLDNKFSERLGTMLEIKCPVTRDIHTSGKVAGDICPFYYYCQVQQQLACCDLDVCDFWQCKLSEYQTREEYLADTCASCVNTVGNSGTKIQVDDRLKKGIILEFYPKNFTPEFEGDLAEWKSKYIIPKRLDMDETQYDTWVMKMMDQYKTLYPDIAKDYYFYRIIYWKLEVSHNVSINRDDKFLASIIPILQETWNKILYYRENQDKLDELKQITEKRKKYIKINTSYQIHNDQIVSGKILILEPETDLKELNKSKTKKTYEKFNSMDSNKHSTPEKKTKAKDYDSDYCDFIDNEECDFIDDVPVLNVTKQTKTDKKVKTKSDVPIKPISQDDNDNCDFLDDEPSNKKSAIQTMINSKGIKFTDFNKKESTQYIRKYYVKQNKNTNTTKFKYDEKNDNDNCEFLD